jgi:hypothetical protein
LTLRGYFLSAFTLAIACSALVAGCASSDSAKAGVHSAGSSSSSGGVPSSSGGQGTASGGQGTATGGQGTATGGQGTSSGGQGTSSGGAVGSGGAQTGSGGGPSPSDGCAEPSAQTEGQKTLSVDGTNRSYYVIPAEADGPVPLVIIFHGHSGTGQGAISTFELPISTAGQAVLMSPDGVAQAWYGNAVGWDNRSNTSPDIAFTKALIE